MKLKKFLLIVALLLIWVFVSVALFFNSSLQIEQDRTNESFFAVTQNNVNTTNIIFAEYATTMTIAARAIEENVLYNIDEDLINFLQEVKNTGRFHCVCFYNKERSLNSEGHKDIKLYEDVGYKLLENTDVYVSDAYYDEHIDEAIVSIRIDLQGNLKGTFLIAKISLVSLSQLLDRSFFTSDGYYHIIDENGIYVATSDSGEEIAMDISFYFAASIVDYAKGYSEQQFLDDVANKRTGVSEYSYEGDSRFMYYMPVGINNWIMTTIIPTETISAFAAEHQRATLYLVISISLALICLVILIIYLEKKSQAKVQLMYESIKSLAQKANKVIIEWDYKTHRLQSVSDYTAMFGRDIILTDIRKDAKNKDVCHEDDLQIVTETLQRVAKGETISNVRFRMKHANGKYLWCSFESTLVKSAKGDLLKSFVFIENIDDFVRQTEKLKKSAERDPLTGLYNKAQTEELIIEELNQLENKIGALFIIDCDNFKLINDTFGHQKGDDVLKEISDGLHTIFRSDDIVGRIGGDEFFAYIKNITSIDCVKKKAKTLCETLYKTYTGEEGSVTISFSVGIALAPNNATVFDELYEKADRALYRVKNTGKNSYRLFSE